MVRATTGRRDRQKGRTTYGNPVISVMIQGVPMNCYVDVVSKG